MRRDFEQKQKGVALLAVLWLAVALSMMALATSYLVRTETEAVRNQIESQQGYYLARGGIEAAVYSMTRPPVPQTPAGGEIRQEAEFVPGQRWLQYEFAGGQCIVEVVPENAKLNVNQAEADQLAALFSTMGLPAVPSAELAAAIVDWRSPRASDVGNLFDAFYANLPQSYLARHAPLEQLEELLPVRGMTPDLFFGGVEQTPQGPWRRRPPLPDLLTTEKTTGGVNPNYASYEVLRALPGWDDALAAAVIAARATAPLESMEKLQAAVPAISFSASLSPLTFAEGSVYTLTATGFLPDSPVRRSVRALVRIAPTLPLSHQVLAWWDDWPFANEPPQAQPAESEIRSRIRS